MIPDTLTAEPAPTPPPLNPEPRTLNPGPGRPPIFDAVKQHTFLRLVSVGFSTRRAARLVGVSPSTVREKARTSLPFACGYEDAKAQAIPALAENVFHAGKRSWRASAWLLERLRPSQFGHRVALGPDREKLRELKRQKAIEASRNRDAVLDENTIRRFFFRMFNNREAQAIAKYYLRYVLDAQICHDRATGECEVVGPTGHYDFDDPTETADELAADQTQSTPDDSDSMATRSVSEEPSPADSPDPTLEARSVSEDCSPTDSAHAEPAQPTSCAPAPSAKNSAPSTTDPITETQSSQPQPPNVPTPTPSNSCALTPRATCAEIPQATCPDQSPQVPSHPPPLSDLAARQCAMITFG
jgi:hypothetical protein